MIVYRLGEAGSEATVKLPTQSPVPYVHTHGNGPTRLSTRTLMLALTYVLFHNKNVQFSRYASLLSGICERVCDRRHCYRLHNRQLILLERAHQTTLFNQK